MYMYSINIIMTKGCNIVVRLFFKRLDLDSVTHCLYGYARLISKRCFQSAKNPRMSCAGDALLQMLVIMALNTDSTL